MGETQRKDVRMGEEAGRDGGMRREVEVEKGTVLGWGEMGKWGILG